MNITHKKLDLSSLFTGVFSAILITFLIGLPGYIYSQPSSAEIINSPVDKNQNSDPYRSRFFSVEGAPNLTVFTTVGDIEVRQNPDLDGVQVDLFVQREFSLWAGSQNLDNYRIILQQSGNDIVASVENRGGENRRRVSRDVQFSFVIQVPTKSSTNLRTVNGKITIDGLEGRHFIQNQNGDLTVSDTKGEIQVASTNGAINLKNLSGNIRVNNVTGRVNIENSEGEIRARTVSGDMITSGIVGVFIGATVTGNIDTGFRDISRGVFMESVSGNISTNLPQNKSYSVRAQGLRYDFDQLNKSYSKVNIRPDHATVEIREGGIPVNLSTVSGVIKVKELMD